MLSHLGLTNFGPIAQADFEFCPGVNVLVGENGTGKSLALRAAWVLLSHDGEPLHLDELSSNSPPVAGPLAYDALLMDDLIDELRMGKLSEVTRSEALEALIRIEESSGDSLAAKLTKHGPLMVAQDRITDATRPDRKPFLLPASDPLAQSVGALQLLDKHRYQSPPSALELSRALLINPVRDESLAPCMRSLVACTHTHLKGELPTVDPQGRLLWQNRSIGLMAEGHRKLAAAAMLLANESIQAGDTLFWDEPEANLNPKLLAFLADWLADLAAAGVQVILSTHSLFLMRAFEIARKTKAGLPMRFFALHHGPDGVLCESADELTELQHLSSLDAELEQEDEYLALP